MPRLAPALISAALAIYLASPSTRSAKAGRSRRIRSARRCGGRPASPSQDGRTIRIARAATSPDPGSGRDDDAHPHDADRAQSSEFHGQLHGAAGSRHAWPAGVELGGGVGERLHQAPRSAYRLVAGRGAGPRAHREPRLYARGKAPARGLLPDQASAHQFRHGVSARGADLAPRRPVGFRLTGGG